ncbi:hypothetical protein ACFLZZ_01285 [Nanoarchaeota archaeon]
MIYLNEEMEKSGIPAIRKLGRIMLPTYEATTIQDFLDNWSRMEFSNGSALAKAFGARAFVKFPHATFNKYNTGCELNDPTAFLPIKLGRFPKDKGEYLEENDSVKLYRPQIWCRAKNRSKIVLLMDFKYEGPTAPQKRKNKSFLESLIFKPAYA